LTGEDEDFQWIRFGAGSGEESRNELCGDVFHCEVFHCEVCEDVLFHCCLANSAGLVLCPRISPTGSHLVHGAIAESARCRQRRRRDLPAIFDESIAVDELPVQVSSIASLADDKVDS
jgi:hypothetical protein